MKFIFGYACVVEMSHKYYSEEMESLISSCWTVVKMKWYIEGTYHVIFNAQVTWIIFLSYSQFVSVIVSGPVKYRCASFISAGDNLIRPDWPDTDERIISKPYQEKCGWFVPRTLRFFLPEVSPEVNRKWPRLSICITSNNHSNGIST